MVEIYFSGKQSNEAVANLDEWTNCKQFVNAELMNWMSTFDPTASLNLAIDGENLASNLSRKFTFEYMMDLSVQTYLHDMLALYFSFIVLKNLLT